MEESNGSLKGPTKAVNGINGGLNGIKPHLANGLANGHIVLPRRRTVPRGPGFFSRSINIVARLLTWYSIITIIFRCPPTIQVCDDTTPRICKPYFEVKHIVSPHLQPYYDAYAAPYVELVQPYYDTIDRTVITPSWGYVAKYGAPRVLRAHTYSRVQWEKNVQPQLLKYQSLARTHYDQSLAPHVDRFSRAVAPYYDIARTNALQTYHEFLQPSYKFLQPYAQKGYGAASAFATNTAIPSAAWAWNKTYFFLDGTVWPQLRVIYVENVEPQLVKIGRRLGRYNGKQTNGKQIIQKPVIDAITSSLGKAASSFTKPSPSGSSTAVSSSLPTTSITTTARASSTQIAKKSQVASEGPRLKTDQVQAPEWEQGEEQDEVIRIARETVAADLKDWQERYAKAADEGAAEIEDRVEEISKRMIRRNARTTGKALLEQLQGSIVSELLTLRHDILDIVGDVSKGNASPDEGREQITSVVRRAGMVIKEKAQEVRSWRENYEAELQNAVTIAAENHFRILDSIRDLAIQKIGMKWAWMDGITYRDWQKYHLLKDRFDEWHGDLEKLIVTHPGLEAAQSEGANIEDEAMKLAQSAAKELGRLKQVASWKLVATDITDEFDGDLMRQAAEAIESAKATAKSEANRVNEHVEDVTESILEAVSGAASILEPSDVTAHPTSTVLSEATESAASAEKSIISNLPDEASGLASKSSETLGIASEATTSAVKVSATASSAISSAVPVMSEATESIGATNSDLASEASTILLAETPVISGNTSELKEAGPMPIELPVEGSEIPEPVILDSTEEPFRASATSSVKPALFGAAAQSVPSRKPIIDDDSFSSASSVIESIRSQLPASFSSMAQSAYSAAVSRANVQYSQALSVVSAQIRGTPEPMHDQMLASVTSAYSNAIASASSRLGDVFKAAQKQLGTTPTSTGKILPTTIPIQSVPTMEWARIESIASERLAQGRTWAEEQYESAKIRIGLATPTPSTPAEHVERLLENARHNYYAGLGIAHARYSEFLAAASSAIKSMTATPTPTDFAGTVSSLASAAAESVASAAGEKASAGYDTVASAAAGAGEAIAGAGDAVAENWDALVSQLSVRVYGAPTPTPWYESLYSAAGLYAASETDGAASATSVAGTYVAVASDKAAEQYIVVSSIISELVIGKEPAFTDSVYSRLSAAYKTGTASAASSVSAAVESAASMVSDATEVVKSSGKKVGSHVSEATEAVKETMQHVRDEL